MTRTLTTLFLSSALTLFASAQSIELSFNSKSGNFAKNQKIRLEATVSDLTTDSIQLKVTRNNNDLLLEKSIPAQQGTFTIYEASYPEPGSIIFEVSAGEATDSIGALIDPNAIKPGSPRPDDFDAFWDTLKEVVRTMPFEVDMQPIELPEEKSALKAFDVELNAPGPVPARAIFVEPANAAPRTLPIVINLHAAGVKGSWCRAHLDEAVGYAERGGGSLSFDLNAHGMLNHEPESYYEELENGSLKNYWDIGNESPETYYFRFMYLRVLRSIEFLTRHPAWDGKRILVVGESQGGGQALAAAGLDPRVTLAVATVPAMCDFGGPLVGRKGGWPQPIDWNRENPKVIATAPYFDVAHLLHGSTARLVVEVGLIDQTCPSTSIIAAINQSGGPRSIYPVTYRAHPWPSEADRENHWNAQVHAQKQAIIDEFLR